MERGCRGEGGISFHRRQTTAITATQYILGRAVAQNMKCQKYLSTKKTFRICLFLAIHISLYNVIFVGTSGLVANSISCHGSNHQISQLPKEIIHRTSL